MKGLELAKLFYFECVRSILAAHVPALFDAHAAGLVGYGSDVIGNDDEFSQDHEWGPRLVLFLSEAEHPYFAEQLDRVFDTWLPPTFASFPTRFLRDEKFGGCLVMTSSSEGKHHIAITTAQRFLKLTIGYDGAPETDNEWLLIPEQRLFEFTNGEIFYDGVGHVTQFRKQLSYFPDNVWKYRLAYAFESLGWELGLIPLCGQRGDLLSMHLNTAITIERIMKLTFLLNRQYCPSYAKWLHREFIKLPVVANKIEGMLKDALTSNDGAAIMSNIERTLDIIYGELRHLDGLLSLPSEMPSLHNRGTKLIDVQGIAKLIGGSISGALGQLLIHGAPYGAVDQWITNEDVLLSPEHIKASAPIYTVQEEEKTKFDKMI